MFSFFRKIISTVIPWGSGSTTDNLEEDEKRIMNSFLSLSAIPEEVLGNTYQTTIIGQSDSVLYDVETYKCLNKSGKITLLKDNYGLIDNINYFEPHQVVGPLTVKVGDEVLYSVYQFKENESFRVFKIYALKNYSWDSETFNIEEQSKNIEKVEEINAFSRIITGRVTKRKNREVYIEPSNTWFHLDKIKTTFIPVEGDWVELQAVVSICKNTYDLMGDILEIKSLKPLLAKEGFGRITFWCEEYKEGAIENLIYFTIIACEDGYLPSLGDEVLYNAVESDQEKFRWRAVKVATKNLKSKNKDMSDIDSNKNSINEFKDDFNDKNGITITPSVCSIEIEFNQKKTIICEVRNTETQPKCLKYVKSRKLKNSQLKLIAPKPSNNLWIKPNQTIQFEFQCCGKNLGLTVEVLYFFFKGFTILKKFEIIVVGNKEMNQLLKCNFDTVVKIFNKSNLRNNDVQSDIVLYGPRPWKPSKFISRNRSCLYPIPQKLWDIAKSTDLKSLKDLNKYAPYLKDKLNFEFYSKRFHTLLYLEEIYLRMNFKKYTMNQVYLTRSDNYFVLEIPGLVERRPSLISGDKVVLTQPWQEGGKVKHIGFIYLIKEKEVYIKFHDSFHMNYNETECDISFEPNVNFFGKLHYAVKTAVETLGKDWLFPSSVNEKPPLIDFEIYDEKKETSENVKDFLKQISINQRNKKMVPPSLDVKNVEFNFKKNSNLKKKLVWFNEKLNNRQKLAVINVLKGKGRPLPYIIFGPPGTGKTVTLVEIVLQIFKLMPESRILIATPSNSSADLISERLIEEGNLKPGQLVRLVALYRVFDGLIPPKLIPYSTFYSPKRSAPINPEIFPKVDIKTLSPEELPGRQRITVATCITVGYLHFANLPSGHFTHIIMDEAGQTSEPEILISSTFQDVRTGQVVLTGDPQQLGPVICNPHAKIHGLGISLMQRLISTFPYARDFESFPDTSGFDPRFITKLIVNYRSVPEILSLPSRLFYNSDLIATISQTDSAEAKIIKDFNFEAQNRETPPAIIFHGIVGQNYQEKDSPSWYNPHEIWQVVFYMRRLYSVGLNCDEIGILSPYSKQVQKLKNVLQSLNLALPKIGSVEEFQGQERQVIIVSTVRSCVKYVESDIFHSLGFVASPQRLNVALTRAKALLIIIGNPVLLSKDPYWANVINYCINNNSYTGCNLNLFNENLVRLKSEELADVTENNDLNTEE